MIQNLSMLDPDQTRRKKYGREMDFLIVHYDSALIINVEVKNALDDDAYSKICFQLKQNREYFENWFTCDISETWRFVSMAYVTHLPDKFRSLRNNNCFAVGEDDFVKALKLMHSQRGSIRVPEEDFRTLAKYLLFALPAIPLPISGVFETKAVRLLVTGLKLVRQTRGSTESCCFSV